MTNPFNMSFDKRMIIELRKRISTMENRISTMETEKMEAVVEATTEATKPWQDIFDRVIDAMTHGFEGKPLNNRRAAITDQDQKWLKDIQEKARSLNRIDIELKSRSYTEPYPGIVTGFLGLADKYEDGVSEQAKYLKDKEEEVARARQEGKDEALRSVTAEHTAAIGAIKDNAEKEARDTILDLQRQLDSVTHDSQVEFQQLLARSKEIIDAKVTEATSGMSLQVQDMLISVLSGAAVNHHATVMDIDAAADFLLDALALVDNDGVRDMLNEALKHFKKVASWLDHETILEYVADFCKRNGWQDLIMVYDHVIVDQNATPDDIRTAIQQRFEVIDRQRSLFVEACANGTVSDIDEAHGEYVHKNMALYVPAQLDQDPDYDLEHQLVDYNLDVSSYMVEESHGPRSYDPTNSTASKAKADLINDNTNGLVEEYDEDEPGNKSAPTT